MRQKLARAAELDLLLNFPAALSHDHPDVLSLRYEHASPARELRSRERWGRRFMSFNIYEE